MNGNNINVNIEYCDPFDETHNYYMRLEHLGRYLWAKDIIEKHNLKNVLDVACASGYGTKILSTACDSITGIDNKEKYLNLAKEKNSVKNINYLLKDVNKENFKNKYDCIVCFETLEHLKNPNEFLTKLYNCLTNNGILLISVPNDKYEIIENGKNKDSYHLHTFSLNALKNIFKNHKLNIINILGQSKTNKIVNNIEITKANITNDLFKDSTLLGYPNNEDIELSYSYIFILKKLHNKAM